jgi:hypothetical protein
MSESWKVIPGWPAYEVSDLGRVRRGSKILKPFRRTKKLPYLSVNLKDGKRQQTHSLHRLVLLAFRGDPPPGCNGAHDDGDATNNRLSNLFWKTQKQNILDRERHGTSAKGEANPSAKLSPCDVIAIRSMRANKVKLSEISGKFGIGLSQASRIARGECWRTEYSGK